MGDDLPRSSLPDDVVQDEIFRRLPPAALAACRCVCKAWRDAIDSRRMLLRSDLLPLGIFLNLVNQPVPPLLFARPSMGRKVAADLRSFVRPGDRSSFPLMLIIDCCNGLLLVEDLHVVNPATRRCAVLPPCPAAEDDDYDVYHLLFDPCVSPHFFQVLVLKQLYRVDAPEMMEDGSSTEWPPSPYMMWVYSSETRRWEETPFVRDGDPAGTLAEAQSAEDLPEYHRAVYYHAPWCTLCKMHGAFYHENNLIKLQVPSN